MSVHLPENLAAISYRAFDKYSKVGTIAASTFSTTALKRDEMIVVMIFKSTLVEAGSHLLQEEGL